MYERLDMAAFIDLSKPTSVTDLLRLVQQQKKMIHISEFEPEQVDRLFIEVLKIAAKTRVQIIITSEHQPPKALLEHLIVACLPVYPYTVPEKEDFECCPSTVA